MSDGEVYDFFAAELAKAYHEKVVALGYWCPRCEMFAPPLEAHRGEHYELGVTPGWCGFCGLDPLVEGPVRQ